MANGIYSLTSSVSHQAMLIGIGIAEKAMTTEWINRFGKWLFGEKYVYSYSALFSLKCRFFFI